MKNEKRFTDSPQTMETSAIITLYKQSVEKNDSNYGPFIGSENNYSYRDVCKGNVYCPTKLKENEDNVGHVAEIMGNRLRSLVCDWERKLNCRWYNHRHNILRLFDTLPNFLFTTSETKPDY